jgi:hypothetical protein
MAHSPSLACLAGKMNAKPGTPEMENGKNKAKSSRFLHVSLPRFGVTDAFTQPLSMRVRRGLSGCGRKPRKFSAKSKPNLHRFFIKRPDKAAHPPRIWVPRDWIKL